MTRASTSPESRPEMSAQRIAVVTSDAPFVEGGHLTIARNTVRALNRYIDEKKPWNLNKTDRDELAKVIYTLLESLRQMAWLLKPLLPTTADGILNQLGVAEAEGQKSWADAGVWGGLKEGGKIAKGSPLFPRLTPPAAENKL